MKSLFYNEDDTDFLAVRAPEEVSGEAIDAWVDSLADAGVGTLLSCVGAMTTNYPSKVWETRWARYDPEGPDDQPVLRYLTPESVAFRRRWLAGAMKLADAGINPHARAFARCRQRGMGAWASVRMNDLHDCTLEDSTFLSTFYKEQRRKGLLRVPYRLQSWQDHALDWERPEVQEHYLKLVLELLETLDLDGLELDWMRFGFHFRPGREQEGGKRITAWMRRVREECERAAQRLGHPVRLGARVPSHPETARLLGMDGAAWAQEGLIDLLVPTPFWETCEFNMPIRLWRRLLAGSRTVLAGGLDVRYQPLPGAEATFVTPELAAGAAMAVLQGGADAVYLFNYFLQGHFGDQWTREQFNATLGAMNSKEALAALPRCHAVTFRDVRAPGEAKDDPLPATGTVCEFRLQTGPRPAGRLVTVRLGTAPDSASKAQPRVRVNGVLCPEPPQLLDGLLVYAAPESACSEETHLIAVETADGAPITVTRVEFRVAA